MKQPVEIQVCGFHELEEQVQRHSESVVSIWDVLSPHADEAVKNLRRRFRDDRLHVAKFDDIAIPTPGKRAATRDDMRKILRFAKHSPSPVLVHCFAGISRSTAVAYAILCQSHGPGEEDVCMERLLRARPQAAPNAYIVALADEVLERNGAMNAAYEMVMRRYILRGTTDTEL